MRLSTRCPLHGYQPYRREVPEWRYEAYLRRCAAGDARGWFPVISSSGFYKKKARKQEDGHPGLHGIMTKIPLDIPAPVQQGSTRTTRWRKCIAACLLVVLAAPFLPDTAMISTAVDGETLTKGEAKCPVQPKALAPKIQFTWDEAYKARSAGLLGRAVVSPRLGRGGSC